jgi:hypothetical protein
MEHWGSVFFSLAEFFETVSLSFVVAASSVLGGALPFILSVDHVGK